MRAVARRRLKERQTSASNRAVGGYRSRLDFYSYFGKKFVTVTLCAFDKRL